MKNKKIPHKFILLIAIIIAVILFFFQKSPTPKAACFANSIVYSCHIGKMGISNNKREGDGTTPAGAFPLRKVFYRADKINRNSIKTSLPVEAITQYDGWCDDPTNSEYNKKVKLPFAGNHEKLWREDDAYDLIIVVGYNDNPVIKGKGSAIFIHINKKFPPTAGCISFSKNDLLTIIATLSSKPFIKISTDRKIEFH